MTRKEYTSIQSLEDMVLFGRSMSFYMAIPIGKEHLDNPCQFSKPNNSEIKVAFINFHFSAINSTLQRMSL